MAAMTEGCVHNSRPVPQPTAPRAEGAPERPTPVRRPRQQRTPKPQRQEREINDNNGNNDIINGWRGGGSSANNSLTAA